MVESRHIVDDTGSCENNVVMNNIKSRVRNSCMSDDHAIYDHYTASVWKWSRYNAHQILVVIITIGLYVVNGYSKSSCNCTTPWLLYYDKNTDKYKCGPAVTGYADVTSTNAGLKSPTQLCTVFAGV